MERGGLMPKVRLLANGPFEYSDGVYNKGDVFEVGQGCFDSLGFRYFELLSDEPSLPVKPQDGGDLEIGAGRKRHQARRVE
jgi:hypothetical protein